MTFSNFGGGSGAFISVPDNIGDPNNAILSGLYYTRFPHGPNYGGIIFDSIAESIPGLPSGESGFAWRVRYFPQTGILRYEENLPGPSGGPFPYIEIEIDGPPGYEGTTPVWVSIQCIVTRINNSVSITTNWSSHQSSGVIYGSDSDTTTETVSNGPISDWSHSVIYSNHHFSFCHGGSAAAFHGNAIWTGVSAAPPPVNWIEYLGYEIERNHTSWTCTEPRPILEGVLAIRSEATTEILVPPSGLSGQHLEFDDNGPYYAKWADPPIELPEDGATGTQLVKAANDDYNIEWAERDLKVFFDTSIPTESKVGDFWYEAAP